MSKAPAEPVCPGCGRHVHVMETHLPHLFETVTAIKDDLESLKRRLAEPLIFNIPTLGDGSET